MLGSAKHDPNFRTTGQPLSRSTSLMQGVYLAPKGVSENMAVGGGCVVSPDVRTSSPLPHHFDALLAAIAPT